MNFRFRNMVRQAHQQVRQAHQPGSATSFGKNDRRIAFGNPSIDGDTEGRRRPLISRLSLWSLIRNAVIYDALQYMRCNYDLRQIAQIYAG